LMRRRKWLPLRRWSTKIGHLKKRLNG
jgi:hypothetical protein